jgi:hypothetical protein
MTLPALCTNYDAPPMSLLCLITKHYVIDIRSSGTSWGVLFSLGRGVLASVIMGPYAYSEPREYRNSLNDYTEVEVAFKKENTDDWFNVVEFLELQNDEDELSNNIKDMFENGEYYLCPYAQIVDVDTLFTMIKEVMYEDF